MTKFILEESKYLEILKAEQTDESRARIENINEMLKAIDEFDNIESALALVKEKSLKATSTPSMYSDIYFIYNDQDIALYKSNFDDGLIKIENG